MFSQKNPEKLANPFFMWYDFRGFVYPFLSRKKLPLMRVCNFDVTNVPKKEPENENSGRRKEG